MNCMKELHEHGSVVLLVITKLSINPNSSSLWCQLYGGLLMHVTAFIFAKRFKSFFPVHEAIMNKGWLCRFCVQQNLIISSSTGCTIHSIFWRAHTDARMNFVPTTLNRSLMRLLLTTPFTAIRLPPFWIIYFQRVMRSVNIRTTWALTWTTGSSWCVVRVVCFVSLTFTLRLGLCFVIRAWGQVFFNWTSRRI